MSRYVWYLLPEFTLWVLQKYDCILWVDFMFPVCHTVSVLSQNRNAKMNNGGCKDLKYDWFGWFKDIGTENDIDLSIKLQMGYKCCEDEIDVIKGSW